jgi:hypothetical protein
MVVAGKKDPLVRPWSALTRIKVDCRACKDRCPLTACSCRHPSRSRYLLQRGGPAPVPVMKALASTAWNRTLQLRSLPTAMGGFATVRFRAHRLAKQIL